MAWEWSGEQLAELARFLQLRGVTRGPVTVRPIGDGHSNLTFLVDDGTHQVVVRRPPPPPVPPGGHDVLREARLLSALAGTDVPVPAVLTVAQAGDVLDVPFYVMGYAEGPVVTTRTPDTLSAPGDRRQIGESMTDILAALHSVDWRASGLADLGRPEGFNARHVSRMARLVTAGDGRMPDGFGEVAEWLIAGVPPESGASLLHNDYRLGNVVLAPDPPGRVIAVLDWELATIGDPLFDVGYFLASWPAPGEALTPTAAMGTAALEHGYPTRAELADRYALRTGRDLGRLDWYTTLALFKLAALYEYSHRRAMTGQGDDYYTDPTLVPSFLEAARQAGGISA